LINVDLPAPFGPRNPNISPSSTERETRSNAVTVPYRFDTPSAVIAVIAAASKTGEKTVAAVCHAEKHRSQDAGRRSSCRTVETCFNGVFAITRVFVYGSGSQR